MAKDQVDLVIEEELTQKLAEDLLQSVERKFQVDLEKAVDMVLTKIKLLLQNGTMHIQDRLVELQGQLESIKQNKETEVESCLAEQQTETTALAEKALHQMVVCGYALIGHDPAQAVRNVLLLKNMISAGLKPLHKQKNEVYSLLKACGHDHDTLKKVIKCVISKSPLMKTTMMDVTSKLLEGIVGLTKLMAHGAMHEACLIEVIKTTEDEAFELVNKVKYCAYGNNTYVQHEVDKYISDNNATVIDVDNIASDEKPNKVKRKHHSKREKSDITDVLRRMLSSKNDGHADQDLKNKLNKLQSEMGSADSNAILNEIKKD